MVRERLFQNPPFDTRRRRGLTRFNTSLLHERQPAVFPRCSPLPGILGQAFGQGDAAVAIRVMDEKDQPSPCELGWEIHKSGKRPRHADV